MDPARWVQPRSEVAPTSASLRAVGEQLAILDIAAHPYLVSATGGLLGALRPPSTATWFGIGADGVVLAASPGGYLHQAAGLAEAPGGAFEPLAHLPEAVTWDAAGAWVVAGGGERLWRSSDGGQSFDAMVVAPGFDVRRVLVRPDGALVVAGYNRQGGQALRLFEDGVWRRSGHAVTQLHRRGMHIRGRSVKGCMVTLADDGATWVGEPDAPAPSRRSGKPREASRLSPSMWTDLASSTSEPQKVHAPNWNAVQPPPPSPRDRPGPNACASGSSRFGASGLLGTLSGGQTCVGVACVRKMPSQRRTDLGFGLLPQPCGTDFARCDASASWAVDHRRARVRLRRALPDGCKPEQIYDLAGAGWLVCRDGRTHALAGDGRTYGEDRLPWRPTDIDEVVSSTDGTTVVSCVDGSACANHVLVRRPAPLGTKGAWREVEVEGAVALAPWTAGRAIAVTSPGDPSVLTPPQELDTIWGSDGDGIGLGRRGGLGAREPAALTPAERARRKKQQQKREARRVEDQKRRAAWEKRKAAERTKLETATVTAHHADGRKEVLGRDLAVPFEVTRLEMDAEGPVILGDDEGEKIFRRIAGGKLVSASPPAKPSAGVGVRPSWGSLEPEMVALDATHLYWIDQDRVLRLARAGGMAEVFAEDVEHASALAVDGAHLYVARRGDGARDGEVVRIAKRDGKRDGGFDGLVRPVAVRVVDATLYVADDGDPEAADGVVYVRNRSGEAKVLLQGLGTIRGVVVDGDRIRVAAGRTVLSVPRRGEAPVEVVGVGRRPGALVVRDGKTWWADAASDQVYTPDGPQPGRFMRVRSMMRHGSSLLIANGNRLAIHRNGHWQALSVPRVSIVVTDGEETFLVEASYRVEGVLRLRGDEPLRIYDASAED